MWTGLRRVQFRLLCSLIRWIVRLLKPCTKHTTIMMVLEARTAKSFNQFCSWCRVPVCGRPGRSEGPLKNNRDSLKKQRRLLESPSRKKKRSGPRSTSLTFNASMRSTWCASTPWVKTENSTLRRRGSPFRPSKLSSTPGKKKSVRSSLPIVIGKWRPWN